MSVEVYCRNVALTAKFSVRGSTVQYQSEDMVETGWFDGSKKI